MTPNWRSPEAYKGVAHLPVCEIAWEFVRRNPAYQSDFCNAHSVDEISNKSLVSHWGISHPTDPMLSAREAEICWRPERCASIIILSQMAPGSHNPCIKLSDIQARINFRNASDGTYVIIRDKEYCFRLFLVSTTDLNGPLQANIPIDDITSMRCDAVKRFYRFLIGETPSSMPRRLVLREKYPDALRAFDGASAGASYREIAEVLFGAARVEQDSWKTSTIRSSTIRLVKMAEELMVGGYKDLLLTNSY